MDEKFIKRLISNMKCAVCGQHYEASNITVLGHKENLWFVNVSCPKCGSQGLVAAAIKEGKAAEVITDLTEAELSKFAGGSPVEADDVLEVHDFLKDFEGDFSALFSK